MASEAAESSRAREEAAEREASEAVARQPQSSWVALASIPVVVYGANDARAAALAPGAADLLLELHDPPRASYLVLPERLAPDPRQREPNNFPYIAAAPPDRLLFMATQGRGVGNADYFLCNASDGTDARLPAVPADFAIKLFPRRTMGLIADPRLPGYWMIAQLHPANDAAMMRHDALLCFSTASGQWSVKQLASAPDHEPWGAHGVIAHGGLLWWVDIACGMLFCDPFDDHPRLRLVPLPADCQMHGLGNSVRPRPSTLMDQRRLIRPSQGMLRYVEIQGLPYDHAGIDDPAGVGDPAVTMWTLVNSEGPHPWRLEWEASFADIWAHDSYVAAGLPQDKVPTLALVDPSNHDVVYFFQDTALFAWDVRARRVVACEACFVDRVTQDPLFQYSRFMDAWEQELPPTVRGDSPASSDGSGGSGPEHEDESEHGHGLLVQDAQGSGGGEEVLRNILMEQGKADSMEMLCKKNQARDYAFGLMSMVTKKRRFSTSVPQTVISLKNGVVFSLNGSKFRILLSYIHSIIHYRLWNFVRGTCIDALTVFGTETKLYTTACEETFHVLVEFEDDLIDLIMDGKQAWFHAILKQFYSLKFKTNNENDYMEGEDCKQLDLSANYKDIAPNDDAGEIPIGLVALKNAFKASKDYSGNTSPELQKALGTWVIYFGESPKFHRVFLACCKAIVMDRFNTLNKVDTGLGLMVREWGYLCRTAMLWVLMSLGGYPVPPLDEELDQITRKNIPGIKTMQDIFNNVCLWSNSSPYQRNFVLDPRSKETPSFRPLDFCSTDEYAKELAKFYRDKIESKTLADTFTFDRDRPVFKTSDETFEVSKIHPSFYAEFCSDADFVQELAKFYKSKIQEAGNSSPFISEASAVRMSYAFAKKMSQKDEMLLI